MFLKDDKMVKTPAQRRTQRKEDLPPIAKSQEGSITTLLGLKGCQVGEVRENDKRTKVKIPERYF